MERRSNPAKAALHRFHLDGQSLAPPSRVTTAPTSDKSGHHFHHHPHRHRHHRDKSQPQSAIQLHAPGGLFPENAPSKVPSRSNGVTPVQSAAGSRRGSLAAGKEDLKEVPSQIVLEKAKEQRGLRDEYGVTIAHTCARMTADVHYCLGSCEYLCSRFPH